MVQYLKHDVSETESVSVFKREEGEPTLVRYKELLITGQPSQNNYPYVSEVSFINEMIRYAI